MHSGLCLNANHHSPDSGAAIIQWNCDPDAPTNELFSLQPAVNGYHIVAYDGMCLEPGGGIAAAHGVIQWPCHSDDDRAEEWVQTVR